MCFVFCHLQMGTNKLASQKGMTSYGTRRHLYDAKIAMDNPLDQSTISLQMGTNKGATQVKRMILSLCISVLCKRIYISAGPSCWWACWVREKGGDRARVTDRKRSGTDGLRTLGELPSRPTVFQGFTFFRALWTCVYVTCTSASLGSQGSMPFKQPCWTCIAYTRFVIFISIKPLSSVQEDMFVMGIPQLWVFCSVGPNVNSSDCGWFSLHPLCVCRL